MENASKALLIAGSILIVILLIAMGVRVFNSTTGTTDAVEGTMKATEVAMFNNKFLQYVGSNKKANEVNALLNIVITNNSTNTRKVKVRLILQDGGGINSTDSVSSINNMISKVSGLSNKNFKILITEGWKNGGWTSGNDENGYITNIYIEDK